MAVQLRLPLLAKFVAATMIISMNTASLVKFLTSPEAGPTIRETGMEPG
jgi:hypothetical protein